MTLQIDIQTLEIEYINVDKKETATSACGKET